MKESFLKQDTVPAGLDKRAHERFYLNIPVKIASRPFSEQPPFINGTLVNISSGGVFISALLDLPIATKIYLEFELNLEELSKLQFFLSLKNLKKYNGKQVQLHTTGVVIRVEKEGSAIIFDTDYTLTPL